MSAKDLVRAAVLSAAGLTVVADAAAGVPMRGERGPELRESKAPRVPGREQKDVLDPSVDVADWVREIWNGSPETRQFLRLNDQGIRYSSYTPFDYQKEAREKKREKAIAILKGAPGMLAKPIDATFTLIADRAALTYQLADETDRKRAVVHCVLLHADAARCDMHAVLDPDQALVAAQGKGFGWDSPGKPSLTRYGDRWLWSNVVSSCPEPEDIGCDHGANPFRVDAVKGTCLRYNQQCVYGRPFAEGRLTSIAGDTASAAGEAWAHIARAEHASVASFAAHVLELMAVGAPLVLVEEATRAQQDEVRHAELALQIARSYGAELELGALDTCVEPRTTLRDVLLGVAREGAVAETLAATECAMALETDMPAHVREVVAQIVADEARHAALAWKTLAWGLPLLNDADRQVVLAALADVVVAPGPDVPAGAGLLGGSEAEAARRWAADHIVAPARAHLMAQGQDAAQSSPAAM